MSESRRRRILYVQYTNPAAYPPLEHSSRILADTGWQVVFLGTGALGADSLRIPPHPAITVRQLGFQSAGWRQKLHYIRFCLWTLLWTLAWRPHWVYASDPLSCPIGLILSWVPGLRVIYHEHDSPNEAGWQSLFQRLILWSRRKLARRSACCILPNQRRVERFKAAVGGEPRVYCVWNCPAKQEVSTPRADLNGHGLWLLYHGSIVPSRLPLTVLSAMAMLPDSVKLRVIGYETVGHRDYVKQLNETAKQLRVSDRLEVIGAVPTRTELLEWCRRSDVGLALMPSRSEDVNEQTMTGASNKPFDYLASGLAVLVSNLPDWCEMYVEADYGMCCDPSAPASLAAAIRSLYENPKKRRAMGERGRSRILEEWNYEMQFASILQHLVR